MSRYDEIAAAHLAGPDQEPVDRQVPVSTMKLFCKAFAGYLDLPSWSYDTSYNVANPKVTAKPGLVVDANGVASCRMQVPMPAHPSRPKVTSYLGVGVTAARVDDKVKITVFDCEVLVDPDNPDWTPILEPAFERLKSAAYAGRPDRVFPSTD